MTTYNSHLPGTMRVRQQQNCQKHYTTIVLKFLTSTPNLPSQASQSTSTKPPSVKCHNLVNIRFIYMKISDNIAEGMPSLQT